MGRSLRGGERAEVPDESTERAAPKPPDGDGAVPVLETTDLSKSFAGALALDRVSLTIGRSEVHGLIGENGSGKSTLIKILAGFHTPDPGGELRMNGELVPLPMHPGQFRDLGISFVHQDLGLVPELSVLENLRLTEVVARRGMFISWRSERRKAREVLDRYGLSIDPRATVEQLPETERALLAIIRAVEQIRRSHLSEAAPCGLLVLDEPTVFLPRSGSDALFSMIRDIVDRGDASILFVSHDIDEIFQITNQVTVLRDGRLKGTVRTAETDESTLIRMIIGRELAHFEPQPSAVVDSSFDISISDVSSDKVEDVNIDLRRGETVGLTGLMGSGYEDLPYILFGARSCEKGVLASDGSTFDLTAMNPRRSMRMGMALIPADRQTDGSFADLSVGDNVTLPLLGEYSGVTGIHRRELLRQSRLVLDQYGVRPPDPQAEYQSLSGGNQQKVLLAKWLQTEPEFILLHEPTQGVDVGARAQIFDLLRAAATAGATILCASSDYEQLNAICDRVVIFGRGRIVRELAGSELSKERIAEQVYNSVAA
jgi:ribose transport system ATP-binding protein